MSKMDNNHRVTRDESTTEQGFGEQEIDLRELIEVLLKRKWIIACVVGLCVLASGLFSLLQREEYVGAVLEYNFEEIEESEYPSGEPFSKSDIISPYIISEVTGEMNLEERGIRAIDITEMAEVNELYYSVDDEDEEPEPAYQYQVSLLEHGDIDIPTHFKRQTLSSIINNYKETYQSEFREESPFPRLTEHEDILDLDYPIASRNIRSYLDMLEDHAEEMAEETEDFHSTQHGMSFNDIARQVDILRDTQFEDISAAISTNSLSRDREAAIRHYESMINELKLEEEKKQREADYALELLQDADELRTGELPSMFYNVIEEQDHSLIEEIYDKLYTDNFYPQLIEVSLEASNDSIDKKYEIERLENEIKRLESYDEDNQHEDIASEVEDDIKVLISELNSLVNIHNEIIEEYYEERASEGIQYAIAPYSGVEGANLQLNVALGAVLGLMIGVFGSFFHEFWTRTKERDTIIENEHNMSG
ncbi:Wzz/FepE/Etk N-terminal domain-containing protein [Natranaerobius trueperi]|uniref:Polysaccharide chain length determinant N-terminal domain-containing protein n=1 Tax=Natranaerobius trueperi TaxID=759412 RepID=A0A226BZ10_9FIRM|nr:Wzz/FepE/Etk N-terminal domain-containing protein [Natranaerobius trueperi]OWZ83347.1 hypothetical protein CDO51_09005 [Natranaerobius trueperi]